MSEFVDYLGEVFAEFGQTNTRPMFGGHGLYYDGIMFGLVADDQLYLKVDKTNQQDFEALELTPFEYNKQGKIITMSYYQAPEEIYDDPALAAEWARKSWGVALEAQNKKTLKSKTKR